MATMSASFVAKRNQGIDAQRATGGDVTRHQRDRRKQNRDGDKGCGVGGTDTIDHVGHETCQRESRGHAEQQAKRSEERRVGKEGRSRESARYDSKQSVRTKTFTSAETPP